MRRILVLYVRIEHETRQKFNAEYCTNEPGTNMTKTQR